MKKKKPSADIVALTSNHLPIGYTPSDVIDLLIHLMGKADRGELRGMAIAWVEGNGDVINQIAEGCAGSALLVASVTSLFHEINKRWSG